jgi:hypothetical protein
MMTYDTFLLSCLMVDMGTNVNGICYESLPYDIQFIKAMNVYKTFVYSPSNVLSEGVYECMVNFLTDNKNIEL